MIAPVVLSASLALAASPDGLDRIQEKIERTHPELAHITGAGLEALPKTDIVIFDVREEREYAVSHLPGAIRVDPDETPEELLARYGDALKGKTAVFYCSVGRRSSDLLAKSSDALSAAGVSASYNLEGGVFRWANEDRALMQDARRTSHVHPYNWFWGRLVEDKDDISYKPE